MKWSFIFNIITIADTVVKIVYYFNNVTFFSVDLKSGDNKVVIIDDDDDIEDNIIIEDAEAVVEEDVAVIEDTEAGSEVIVIEDDEVVVIEDDEEDQPPSVTGVVEYMRAHGDYPYISEEPESGSQPLLWCFFLQKKMCG